MELFRQKFLAVNADAEMLSPPTVVSIACPSVRHERHRYASLYISLNFVNRSPLDLLYRMTPSVL